MVPGQLHQKTAHSTLLLPTLFSERHLPDTIYGYFVSGRSLIVDGSRITASDDNYRPFLLPMPFSED
jgi:hypothetical protein